MFLSHCLKFTLSLTNLLTFLVIANRTCISESLKIMSPKERNYGVCVSESGYFSMKLSLWNFNLPWVCPTSAREAQEILLCGDPQFFFSCSQRILYLVTTSKISDLRAQSTDFETWSQSGMNLSSTLPLSSYQELITIPNFLILNLTSTQLESELLCHHEAPVG